MMLGWSGESTLLYLGDIVSLIAINMFCVKIKDDKKWYLVFSSGLDNF